MKLTALLDCSRPGTAAGRGPAPLSTVSETSVAFVVEMRLVTVTFRKTVRLSVIAEPGAPPEQVRRMSPRVSLRLSARTAGFPDAVIQLRSVDWGWAIPAKKNRAAKKGARTDIRLLGDILGGRGL